MYHDIYLTFNNRFIFFNNYIVFKCYNIIIFNIITIIKKLTVTLFCGKKRNYIKGEFFNI